MIEIHWDFTDGTEVSYQQGLMLKDGFTTCCLDFFSNDTQVEDVIVVDRAGNWISKSVLLENTGEYTDKEIRHEHNLHKMLVAGAFKWQATEGKYGN